jgi:hypothetical protein
MKKSYFLIFFILSSPAFAGASDIWNKYCAGVTTKTCTVTHTIDGCRCSITCTQTALEGAQRRTVKCDHKCEGNITIQGERVMASPIAIKVCFCPIIENIIGNKSCWPRTTQIYEYDSEAEREKSKYCKDDFKNNCDPKVARACTKGICQMRR